MILYELWESWLMELAAIKAKELLGDNQFKHYNNNLLQRTARMPTYCILRQIKRISGTLHRCGLTEAIVTQEDGSVIE